MKNLLLRSLTGLIYVVIITTGIIVNQYTFLGLFSLILVVCLWEFYNLINRVRQVNINPYFNCLGGILLFLPTYLYASGISEHFIFYPFLFYIVISFILELYQKKQDPLVHLAYTFLGQCYITLPVSILNMIAFQTDAASSLCYSPLFILSLFAFIWMNDTGAYLVGITFGKHRLFERISPKKSWEGFFGGLIFTILSSLAFAYYEPAIPYYHWIGLSAMIVIFGTWGDLVESLFKRTLEVKDSGNSLPGHGGFLDRFDSLLLAIYGMFFYVELFIQS